MRESGIGRAHNLAPASLPGFTLPGDISASVRYYARDLVESALTIRSDGTAEVPKGPGPGVEIVEAFFAAHADFVDRLDPVGTSVAG